MMDEFTSPYEWNAIGTPQLVMGGDGSTALSWVVELTDPSDEGSQSKSRLHAMYRPPRSHWQRMRLPARYESGAVADVDDNGVALVITHEDRVQRLVRCDGATCVRGKRLPEDWPLGGGILDADVSPDGEATSILLSKMVHQGGGSVIFSARRDGAGWSVPVRISPPPEDETYYEARQVMDDHLSTVLVGGRGFASPIRIEAITGKGGADDTDRQTLAEGDDLVPLGLWSNDGGAMLALWTGNVELEDFTQASYRPNRDATWSGPADLPSVKDDTVMAGTVLATGGGLVLWFDGERIVAWSWTESMP
ncbi:hypothetical protein [Nocardioides sp. zg-1230]|uniref:hypothetical protein n=1 Tax=Nocardioides sp. zg-1230 TaxID=2736601 RepID=UPI001555F7C1|nr:hypothetical protein [Nocardioides sp. zg-1230]NPC41210.1 hypothetical protein [Nocardioides sp. zg-1230]